MSRLGQWVDASATIAASPGKLWESWTVPEGLNRWYTRKATGEPRLRSIYTWHFDPFFGPGQTARVQEVDPGHSMLLTLGAQLLAMRLVPVDGLHTRVDVIHAGLPGDEPVLEDCRSGWVMSLHLLKFSVETYPGQERQELFLACPIDAPAPSVHAAFAESKLRRRWLKMFDPPRDTVMDTGREVLMRWDAIGGALELKQFGWNGFHYAALRASSWSPGYELHTVRPALEESLRLLHSVAG